MLPRMASGEDSLRAPRSFAHRIRPLLPLSAVIRPLRVVANTCPSMYAGDEAASRPTRRVHRRLPVFVLIAQSSPLFLRNHIVPFQSTGWYSISVLAEWVQSERYGGFTFFASAAGR